MEPYIPEIVAGFIGFLFGINFGVYYGLTQYRQKAKEYTVAVEAHQNMRRLMQDAYNADRAANEAYTQMLLQALETTSVPAIQWTSTPRKSEPSH